MTRLLAIAFVVCIGLNAAEAFAQAGPGMSQRLASLSARARQKGGSVRVVATLAGARADGAMLRSRGNLEARARALGARYIRQIADLPVVAMTVDESTLASLVASGLITDVHEDYVYDANLASSIPVINADQVHAAGVRGLTPAGTPALIGIIDTGIDTDHPDLNVVEEFCFSTTTDTHDSACPNGLDEEDGPGAAEACVGEAAGLGSCFHGTYVAGIAAGTHGVAPGAEIVAVNAFSVTDCGSQRCLRVQYSDLLNALATLSNYSVNEERIAVVNMSLGSTDVVFDTVAACQAHNPTLYTLVNAMAQYTPVVVSSGNELHVDGINFPSCIPSAIAVGAMNDYDVLWAGSNVGSLIDLWAPGHLIESTTVGGGTRTGSGTSAAAPHVAGAIALMKQFNPDLYWADALALLDEHGVPVTYTSWNGSITRARIDTLGAVAEVSKDQNTPATGEEFGQALAVGDFNLDGYDDLAVGVRQDVGSADNVGAVDIYYGSDIGPGIIQVWDQGKLGVSQVAGDRFGEALAAGDFNNDGADDLAIGVPGEEFGSVVDAGAVYVLYGSLRGLSATAYDLFGQSTPNIADTSETGDEFGQALATGDFNDDGADDLAIGVPNEQVGNAGDAGGVHVIYGATLHGLGETALADYFAFQTSGGMPGDAESADHLGAALAVSDFDNDGYDDLAVGEPGDVVAGKSGAGSVTILFGSANGARAIGRAPQFFSQEGGAVNDEPDASDAFAFALTAADFDNDSYADLVVGVPNEDFPNKSNAGAFHLFKGTSTGLSAHNMYTQDTQSVNDEMEAGDKFGYSLAAGDLNSDGYADLLCSAPNENNVRGIVHVIYGSAGGLSASAPADQTWSQADPDIPGADEDNDQFGFAVAIGDFNGAGGDDIAVSVPNEVLSGVANAGYVNVLFQAAGGITDIGSLGLSE